MRSLARPPNPDTRFRVAMRRSPTSPYDGSRDHDSLIEVAVTGGDTHRDHPSCGSLSDGQWRFCTEFRVSASRRHAAYGNRVDPLDRGNHPVRKSAPVSLTLAWQRPNASGMWTTIRHSLELPSRLVCACCTGTLPREVNTCSARGTENRPGRRFGTRCGAALSARCASDGTDNEAAGRVCGDCGTAK